MRKHILLLFLLLCFNLVSAQNNREYSIAILADKNVHNTDLLLNRLQAEIKSVVAQEATIVFKEKYFLLNQLNQNKAKQNYEAVINAKDVDLILSFGSLNNFVIAQSNNFPKPVVLFGVINGDFIEFPEDQKSSNVKNLTYILTPQSYKKDLSDFKEMYPYKKVGIIVDKYLTEIYPVEETLDKILTESNSQFKLISISSVDELNSELNDVDAVYLSGGQFYSEEDQRKMIDIINSRKLPSYTSMNKRFSDLGILFNSQPVNKLDQFFRRIALNIEAAVLGKNLSELPVYLDIESKLLLNIETSFKIEFPLKYSFLIKTNIVGSAKNIPFQKKYYLHDVVYQLLEKNLNLKASKYEIKLGEKDVKLANSEYLPNISSSVTGSHIDPNLAKVSNGSNPEYTTSGNINLEQILFSEQVSANIKIQKELEKATRENYNAKEKDAILDAGLNFYNALIAKSNYLISDENLRVTRKNFEIAKQNYSVGQTGKSDVLRWRSELALATQNVVNAYTNYIQTIHALNQILNNPINYKIDIAHSLVGENAVDEFDYEGLIKLIDDPVIRSKLLNYLEQIAIENAHELKSLQFNIAASKRNERLFQRSKFLPSISLQGAYNHTFTRNGEGVSYRTGFSTPPDGYYNIGVQLSLPIFNKNQRNLNRQKSLIQQDQLKLQKENTETVIRRNVNDIVYSILNLYTNIELSKLTTRTAKESLELMQISYSNGAVDITSLIDSQQAYFQAEQQQASAGYNFYLSLLQMERILSYYFFLNSDEGNQNFIQNLQNYLISNNQ